MTKQKVKELRKEADTLEKIAILVFVVLTLVALIGIIVTFLDYGQQDNEIQLEEKLNQKILEAQNIILLQNDYLAVCMNYANLTPTELQILYERALQEAQER